MELTDKCKEAFEKWFKNKYLKLDSSFCNKFFNEKIFTPDSMRYGVYEDFFDTVGIIVEIQYNYITKLKWSFIIVSHKGERILNYTGGFITRPEARIETIKRANEIYNKDSVCNCKICGKETDYDLVDKLCPNCW